MNSKHAIPPEWRDYIAGGGAAVANICITYPVYKTSFRQIVHGFSTRNAIHQLRKEGLRILFRGSLPPLLQKGTSTSLLFGTNAQYQRVLKERIGLREEFHVQAGAAFMAGSTEAAILTPFERVQMLLQDRKYHSEYKNTKDVFVQLSRNGPKELYRGMTAVLMRNGPTSVTWFCGSDWIQANLPQTTPKLLGGFLAGALPAAVNAIIFYPVIVTKTHMQVKVGGGFDTFWTVFKKLWEKRGLPGIYKGALVYSARSFLSWGIIKVSKDLFITMLNPPQ